MSLENVVRPDDFPGFQQMAHQTTSVSQLQNRYFRGLQVNSLKSLKQLLKGPNNYTFNKKHRHETNIIKAIYTKFQH